MKAMDPNKRIIKLYDSVQNIAAKIHAAGGMDLLEVEMEYILLINSFLPQE